MRVNNGDIGFDKADRLRLQRALSAAEVGLWEYRDGDATTWMNASAARFFGVDPDTGPEGRIVRLGSVMRAVHPDDVAEVRAQIEGEAAFRATFRTNPAATAPRWLRASGDWAEVGGERRLTGVMLDVTPEMSQREEAELLIHEMRHRTGNLFSILGGLTMLNAAAETSAAGLARTLRARLSSLARSHSLSLGADASLLSRPELHHLIETLIDPFAGDDRARFTIEGPDTALSEPARTAFSLVIYEWLTNAVKYGALSTDGGRIAISWRIECGRVLFAWVETGGPAVSPPTRAGFGDRMQMAALSRIGGVAERDWRPDGLAIELRAPADLVLAEADAPAAENDDAARLA